MQSLLGRGQSLLGKIQKLLGRPQVLLLKAQSLLHNKTFKMVFLIVIVLFIFIYVRYIVNTPLYDRFSIVKLTSGIDGTVYVGLYEIDSDNIEYKKLVDSLGENSSYYIEGSGLCVDARSDVGVDDYTEKMIDISSLKYGKINYLESSCDLNSDNYLEANGEYIYHII